MTTTEKEHVLNRMYNWKLSSAYNVALTVPEFPQTALSILKDLSEEFGNCGWQDGTAFDSLLDRNNQVADILGYQWNDDLDKWEPKPAV